MGADRPMSGESRARRLDGLAAFLLGGAALALYIRTLAPTVLAGDAGEFQFAPYLLGVAHPTGYPLYLLLGWAWSHLLPWGDVAYRMNLFSAVCAAVAVGLLYPATRALLRQAVPELPPLSQRLLAALAALTFAASPTFWSQSVIAEVYSLHLLLMILLLDLLLLWGENRSQKLLLLAAGCFGLGLAHHRTTLLLTPALLAYLWWIDRRILTHRRLILPALALALLPLLLYLVIPWRAPHTPYLHLRLAPGRELTLYDSTPAGFVRFVLGGAFGGSLDASVDFGERLSMAGGFLRAEFGWIGLALALIGLLRLAWGRRWALLLLTSLALAATVTFNLVYIIGDIYVLYIPAFLMVVLWLAVGSGVLIEAAWRLFGRRRLVSALAAIPFLLFPLWLAASHYAAVDQSWNREARAHWEGILAQPLPPGAILISNDRNDMMPLWYLQYVGSPQPLRPDLLGLFPLITPQVRTLGSVLDLALSTGRPTYLIKEMVGIEVKVNVQREGRLWRVRGPAAEKEPAHLCGDGLAEQVILVGYDRSPDNLRPGETLQVSLYWQPLQPLQVEYHSYVHLLDPLGQKVTQSDRQPGGVYYPTTLWQPGERLRDDHLLTVPANAQPGVYRLVAGMYALAGDGSLTPLGEPIALGEMRIGTSQLDGLCQQCYNPGRN